MSKLRLNLVMVMEETLETERRQGSGLEVAHLQTFFTAKGVHKRSSQVPATIMEEEEHVLRRVHVLRLVLLP